MFYLVQILILLFLFGAILYISSLFYSLVNGAPYVPTSSRLIRDILKRAKLPRGARFLELGCGDGRVVSMAVSEFGAIGKGVEINPMLIVLARLRSWLVGAGSLELLRADVRQTPLKGYSFIFLYLFPGLIESLQERFLTECSKGTVIISHGFKIPALQHKLTDTRPGKPFNTYYYTI